MASRDKTWDDRPDVSGDVRRGPRLIAACVLAVVVLTAFDLVTKQWAIDSLSMDPVGEPPPVCEPDERGRIAMQRLQGKAVELVPGYLELRYAENCGAAFGLMREAPLNARRAVFGIAALIASIALMWMFVRGRGGGLFAASVPFIVSGAIGNFVDRARYGYVVDFIRVHVQEQWEWPTFNIADTTITIGVVLLLLDGIREGRREKQLERERKEAKAGDAKATRNKADDEATEAEQS